MASAAPPPPDAEPPECPVCLSPFDAASVVPRVLPCGHSLCGSCISSLPPASASAAASSLRCPLCSQCVPFSRALGPSSLPKNLALLSLLPSLPNPSPPRTAGAASASAARPLPLPLHAAHSRLLARFRHAILPESASPLHSSPPGHPPAGLALGSIACDLGAPWFCSRGPPAATLWLVSERHTPGVPPLLNERSDELETVARIGAVGMEVCEALMGLHGEGMVLGCLRLDCFRLDHFGRCLLDLNEVLALCRGVRAGVCLSMDGALVAPEMTAILRDATWMRSHDFDGLIGRNSDVWLLGCILVALVTGDERLAAGWNTDGSYDDWQKEVLARLDAALVGTQLEPLVATTALCLSYEPESRPEIADVWKCIRGSQMKPGADALAPADDIVAQKSFRCLLLGELSSMCSAQAAESDDIVQPSQDSDDKNSTPDDESNCGFSNGESVCTAGTDEPQRNGVFKSSTLLAHRDCVTGLAIGGGFLFSSSYDKTINVWSLQDFSHVQTLKGHEHKITAIVVVDNDNQSLCVSGDSGSGIFVWRVGTSLKQEPLNKWYETNDWIYRGVHCLAVSGTGYLYTGSRDKSIKAWSLEIWKDDVLVKSEKLQNASIYAVKLNGKWLYTGGMNKAINIQELLEDKSELEIRDVASISCDSIVTSILYWDEKLIVGLSNREIKVYDKGS
uniref:Myosin heavy chain kinase B n=1 Tax=Aegilops tauschii TaxID=37682 RepID=R7VZA3_AEGTA